MPTTRTAPAPAAMPSVAPAAVYSFLKDTRGAVSWPTRELERVLQVSPAEAGKILALLEMQGYVKPAEENGEWMTTAAGESVARSKVPRLRREKVEEALATLSDRIAAIHRDKRSQFRIAKAVAFGDFLRERAQVQPAEVGVELLQRDRTGGKHDAESERSFLRELQRNSRYFAVRPYEPWMSTRSHRSLL